MRDLIDLDDLLIFLHAECLLTDDDTDKLKVVPPHNTRNVVIRELAHLIKRKGENGLVKFMSALRKSASQDNQPGHQELLQLLKGDLGPSTESSDCSSSPIQEQTHAPQMEECCVPNPASSFPILESHRQLSVATSEETTCYSFISERNVPPHSSESSLSSSPSHHPVNFIVPNPMATTVSPEPSDIPLDAWKEESLKCVSPTVPVAETPTQMTRRRISRKDQDLDPLSQEHALEQHPNPKPVTNTNERDLLHELGCQLFNTCEYHVLRRYDHNVRRFIRCLCAALLIYQFVAMMIVTLCEESSFLTVFQESENKYGAVLHCFLLFMLRIGTRVITPVLFLSQLDVPAATPQIPKSRLKVHEATQQILVAFKKNSSKKYKERVEARLSDPSAVIKLSGGLIKRHIKSSWIMVLHSLFFTWLLYYLGAFSMAVDKVIKREGICDINFLYTTTIHPPLVSSPISLQALGECVSILATLLMVGILKEFYLYENRIATYVLVLGKEGEELYNMFRERWGTLDRYCYCTPPILFLLAGLALLSGRGLTPEPSQEIEAINVVNWYFWISILSALTFLATYPNIVLKVACLIGYAVVGVLVYIIRGEHLTIPAVSDCAVFLLYICHAVVLINFHVSLLTCHYYHYKQTNSVASIYHLGYCVLCIGLLVISVILSVHWEVFNFGRFL